MGAVFRWTGVVLLAALGVFLVLFGAFYASVTNLLFFHAAAVPKEALEAVRPIYFALMKLIGGASVGLGVLGLYVTVTSVRQGRFGAALMVVISYAIAIVMAAVVAETLAKVTGAPTSWHIMGGLMAVALVGLGAAFAGRTRKPG